MAVFKQLSVISAGKFLSFRQIIQNKFVNNSPKSYNNIITGVTQNLQGQLGVNCFPPLSVRWSDITLVLLLISKDNNAGLSSPPVFTSPAKIHYRLRKFTSEKRHDEIRDV